jgi:hypothetical protein
MRDAVTPVINEYINAQAFKNCMLRYWPHDIVNGNTIFKRLYIWEKNNGGNHEDADHMRIYNQLGMTKKALEKMSHSHLDNIYFYLKAPSNIYVAITKSQVQAYIQQFSPLIYPLSKDVFNSDPLADTQLNPDPYKETEDALWDDQGWISVRITYKPTNLYQIDNQISDADILAKIGDTLSIGELHYGVEQNSRLAALAMLDNSFTTARDAFSALIIAASRSPLRSNETEVKPTQSNVVFQTQAIITSRNISEKTINLQPLNRNISISGSKNNEQFRYLISAQILFKFRRVTDVDKDSTLLSLGVNSYLDYIVSEANGQTTDSSYAYTVTSAYVPHLSIQSKINTSMFKQLSIMYNFVTTYNGNKLIVTVDDTVTDGYYPNEAVTTMNALSTININTLASLPPKEFKKSFAKCVTTGYHVHKNKGHWYDVVVEILIVVIAIVALALGQGEITVLLLASLAEVGWAMYLSHNGGSPSSIHLALGIANVLGIIAMIDVFAAAIEDMILQASIDAATNAAKEAIVQALIVDAATMIGAAASLAASFGLINSQTAMYIGIATASVAGLEDLTVSLTDAAESQLSVADRMENFMVDKFDKFVSKPLGEIMNQTIRMINAAFELYISVISPPDKGSASLEAALKKSKEEVANSNTNPEDIENMWKIYTDRYSNPWEMGDMYDKSYPLLTEGLNQRLMNKCYYSGF